MNSEPHSAMCARCHEFHELESNTNLSLYLNALSTSKCFQDAFVDAFPCCSSDWRDGKLSRSYTIAYKPFGERSPIYLCPTALQWIHFFASLHWLENLQKNILAGEKKKTKHNYQLTWRYNAVSTHLCSISAAEYDRLVLWTMDIQSISITFREITI